MIIQPQVEAVSDSRRAYWLAKGEYQGRVILAEGETRQDAWIQWNYATLHKTSEECKKLMGVTV